jgi:hypothetical protein
MEGGSGDNDVRPLQTSAEPTGVAHTRQPEKDLQPGDPNLTGAAPVSEKKGIADKVKGLLGGHKQQQQHGNVTDHTQQHQPGVYGDATPGTGTTDTKVGCLDKIKGMAAGAGGHGHTQGNTPVHTQEHTPGSTTESPYSSQGAAPTGVGHNLDPTGPAPGQAGHQAFEHGRTERSPYDSVGAGPGSSPDFNGGTNVNSSAAVHGGWPQPTNPVGLTNSQGGAVLGDRHGNVHEGPRDDTVKKEGFISKIMDKLHSPKGKHTTATDAPAH